MLSIVTMVKMREDIFNKIMLYNSHPVADLFKKEFELRLRIFENKCPNSQLFAIWCLMEELEMEWGEKARCAREFLLRHDYIHNPRLAYFV